MSDENYEKIKGFLPRWLVTGSLLFIALGQFNDSFTVIERVKQTIVSNFTYTPYYDQISTLYVNGTYFKVKEVFGEAKISKKLSETLSVDYYIEDSHIVGIIHDQIRVNGFYVLALEDDFNPSFRIPFSKNVVLGNTLLKDLPGQFGGHGVDISRSQNYYIESIAIPQSELFFYFLQGYVGDDLNAIELIQPVYESDLLEEDNTENLARLRKAIKPNLFGVLQPELEMENTILLSRTELEIFNAND